MSTQFERDEQIKWEEMPPDVAAAWQRNLRRPRQNRCRQSKLWDCNDIGNRIRTRHRYISVATDERPIGTWELSLCTKCGILVYEDMPF